MSLPTPQSSGHRSARELMPAIYVEISVSIIFWVAWLCRAALGFDPLRLFHRGPSASASYYLWTASIISGLTIWLVAAKIRMARILAARGIESTAIIVSTARRYRGQGWDVKVVYKVDGREISIVRMCETKNRPTEKAVVPIVYDPQKPSRCWIGIGLRVGR
jgi:hypothetical protein